MDQKPDKLIPALYGGIIMAFVSAIPFLNFLNCFCCAGIMLGGFLGVFFYKNNFTPGTPPFTSGDCMAVGALSGVMGAVFGTLLTFASLLLFGNVMGEFMTEMIRNMELEIPPEAWDAIDESLSAGFTAFSFILQLVSNLILYTIFGLLGGLIGYSIYKPKGVPVPQAPMPPPVQ